MNYLAAVQKAIRWSGARSTEPTTLVGATGLVKQMADFVADSWAELQLEREDWYWNKHQTVVGTITANNNRFFLRTSAASGGTDNKLSGVLTYDTSDGSITVSSTTLADVQYNFEDCKVGINDDTDATTPDEYLHHVRWNDWRYHLEDFSDDTKQQPVYYTIAPDGNMLVYPTPEAAYRLFFEIPKTPQILAADADEIRDLPEYLQNGVVWRAILYYALYQQDMGMVEWARVRYRPYKKWLEDREMPDVTIRWGELY